MYVFQPRLWAVTVYVFQRHGLTHFEHDDVGLLWLDGHVAWPRLWHSVTFEAKTYKANFETYLFVAGCAAPGNRVTLLVKRHHQ
jgi:prepilin-type processing-associated H-X9-DG protein